MKRLTLLNPSNLNPNMKLFHQYLRRKFVSFGTKYNNKVQVINVHIDCFKKNKSSDAGLKALGDKGPSGPQKMS
jgi:hypothetical protein